jgi:hypothetical protein
MPTFILSLNWTDQGIRGVKDAPKRSHPLPGDALFFFLDAGARKLI